jgi:hypothetical protein
LNKYLFKTLFIFLFLFAGTMKISAQDLKFLIPDDAIVQYAGSIGYFSVGAGYDIFKNKKGNIDFHYGYVPASKGGELHIVTAKFAYKPFEIKLDDWGTFYPFNPGVFFTYTFHNDLPFKFHSNQYPSGYYYWSSALRPHLSFTNEIELSTAKVWKDSKIKKIGIYTEFNTNDYYLINYIQNTSTLSLFDAFQLGIGIRLKL